MFEIMNTDLKLILSSLKRCDTTSNQIGKLEKSGTMFLSFPD